MTAFYKVGRLGTDYFNMVPFSSFILPSPRLLAFPPIVQCADERQEVRRVLTLLCFHETTAENTMKRTPVR